MIERVKPKALRPGATLGIVSPASAAKADLVERGVAELQKRGYRTKLFPHALTRGPLYYAGSVGDRVADLHAAFADPEIDGIICTRGGWGSAELLPYLDARLVRAHPKVFVGYSDHTSLHLWLARECGLVSFQGPMVAADFSRTDGPDQPSWDAALGGADSWTLGAETGLRMLRPGTAEGVLSGGCISIYAEALGTPFAPEPRTGVLFLEDIGVKPYQWDRMLVHLRLAGMLAGVTGIVFGDMEQCCAAAEDEAAVEASILHALRDFAGPVGVGLKSGHVSVGNVTLPFGVRVRLELGPGNPRMHFLESAVEG